MEGYNLPSFLGERGVRLWLHFVFDIKGALPEEQDSKTFYNLSSKTWKSIVGCVNVNIFLFLFCFLFLFLFLFFVRKGIRYVVWYIQFTTFPEFRVPLGRNGVPLGRRLDWEESETNGYLFYFQFYLLGKSPPKGEAEELILTDSALKLYLFVHISGFLLQWLIGKHIYATSSKRWLILFDLLIDLEIITRNSCVETIFLFCIRLTFSASIFWVSYKGRKIGPRALC